MEGGAWREKCLTRHSHSSLHHPSLHEFLIIYQNYLAVTGNYPTFAPAHRHAEIAQLVEHDLAKVGVAGSSPVFRSTHAYGCRNGGIGRHEGLKIPWPVMAVRVRVPLAAHQHPQPRHNVNRTRRRGYVFSGPSPRIKTQRAQRRKAFFKIQIIMQLRVFPCSEKNNLCVPTSLRFKKSAIMFEQSFYTHR